ncbi:hypothetical protein GGR57DRAFT_487530 [Xylariaceae sp. FL1272]|nr:hypothetical protein GGR57DRAFT_487530 [Xylariaceae sp. FL1272]
MMTSLYSSAQPTAIIYTHATATTPPAHCAIALAIHLYNGLQEDWVGGTYQVFAIPAPLVRNSAETLAHYCAYRVAWSISQVWFARHKHHETPFVPIRFEIISNSQSTQQRLKGLYQNPDEGTYGSLPEEFRPNLLEPLHLLVRPRGYQKRIPLASGYTSRSPEVRTSWGPLDGKIDGLVRVAHVAHLGVEFARRLTSIDPDRTALEIIPLSSFLSDGKLEGIKMRVDKTQVEREGIRRSLGTQGTYYHYLTSLGAEPEEKAQHRKEFGDNIEAALKEALHGARRWTPEPDSDNDIAMHDDDALCAPNLFM